MPPGFVGYVMEMEERGAALGARDSEKEPAEEELERPLVSPGVRGGAGGAARAPETKRPLPPPSPGPRPRSHREFQQLHPVGAGHGPRARGQSARRPELAQPRRRGESMPGRATPSPAPAPSGRWGCTSRPAVSNGAPLLQIHAPVSDD